MVRIIDIKRVEFSVTEPVTKAEVKERLKIYSSTTEYDTEIDNLIPRVRKWVENTCNISIVNTRITLTAVFEQSWELPYGPVIGLEWVATKESTIGSGIPAFTTLEEGWELEGDEYPKFCTVSFYTHKLIYTAGYQTVPYDLKLGILDAIAYFYRNRGDVPTADQLFSVDAFEKLVPYYRAIWI